MFAKASVLLKRIAKSSFVVVEKYSGLIILRLTKLHRKKDLDMYSAR